MSHDTVADSIPEVPLDRFLARAMRDYKRVYAETPEAVKPEAAALIVLAARIDQINFTLDNLLPEAGRGH